MECTAAPPRDRRAAAAEPRRPAQHLQRLTSTLLACSRCQGTFIDKKCPFTGNVSIRGRILKGLVVSTKMTRTIIVRRDYLRYVKKYRRCVSPRNRVLAWLSPRHCRVSFEKKHRNVAAHCSPAFTVKEGDVVTIGQCR